MAEILKQNIINNKGVAWVRTHGTDPECNALCSPTIHPDIENVELGIGQITCPDCIQHIQKCQEINPDDLTPEYYNEMHNKRFDK